MSDIIDVATDTVVRCTEDAERRARGKSAPETHPDFDGAHCVDCDVEIPAQRLAWGRVRCTDCQTILEAKQRRAGYNFRVEQ